MTRSNADTTWKTHDAIVVSIGTALVDDPELTCRLPGMAQDSPVRVVVDTRLQLPLEVTCTDGRDRADVIIVSSETMTERYKEYAAFGVEFIEVAPGADHHRPLRIAGVGGARFDTFAGRRRWRRPPCSGGLVDRLAWFRAPGAIGSDGIPVAPYGVDQLITPGSFSKLGAGRQRHAGNLPRRGLGSSRALWRANVYWIDY